MRLSVIEGVMFAWMVGLGETYIPVNAIQMGASGFEVAMLFALPLLLGGLGPVFALRILLRVRQRRVIVALSALFQAVVLLILALANAASILTVPWLIAAFCLYQICGQGGGAVWGSWYGDLVPRRVRGSYFSYRNRLVHLFTFLGLLVGGVLLWLLEPTTGVVAVDGAAAVETEGSGLGFALLFLLAGLFRLLSAILLWRSPEPEGSVPAAGELHAHLRTQHGQNARRLLIGCAIYQVAVYLSAPFYSPYMLDVLRFDYLTFTLIAGSQVAAKVLAMRRFGRIVDRVGARHAFAIGMVLSALVPLPWMFIEGVLAVLVAQVLSGIAWGGYEVALFALMLDSSSPGTRTQLFAAQSVGNGIGQVTGSLAGSAVLDGHGYAAMFGVSFAARLAVALVLPNMLVDVRPAGVPRREPMLLRIIGFRPGPGLNHRPIPEPTPIAPEPDSMREQGETMGNDVTPTTRD